VVRSADRHESWVEESLLGSCARRGTSSFTVAATPFPATALSASRALGCFFSSSFYSTGCGRTTGSGRRHWASLSAAGDLRRRSEGLLLLPPERLPPFAAVGGGGMQEGSEQRGVRDPAGALQST
jgi:hypothetical protein